MRRLTQADEDDFLEMAVKGMRADLEGYAAKLDALEQTIMARQSRAPQLQPQAFLEAPARRKPQVQVVNAEPAHAPVVMLDNRGHKKVEWTQAMRDAKAKQMRALWRKHGKAHFLKGKKAGAPPPQ